MKKKWYRDHAHMIAVGVKYYNVFDTHEEMICALNRVVAPVLNLEDKDPRAWLAWMWIIMQDSLNETITKQVCRAEDLLSENDREVLNDSVYAPVVAWRIAQHNPRYALATLNKMQDIQGNLSPSKKDIEIEYWRRFCSKSTFLLNVVTNEISLISPPSSFLLKSPPAHSRRVRMRVMQKKQRSSRVLVAAFEGCNMVKSETRDFSNKFIDKLAEAAGAELHYGLVLEAYYDGPHDHAVWSSGVDVPLAVGGCSAKDCVDPIPMVKCKGLWRGLW